MSMLNTIKVSAFAILSGVLIATPSFAQNAAGTTQVSKQQYGQVGIGNMGTVTNDQTAITDQSGGFFRDVNGASTVQENYQQGKQQGIGNTMDMENSQDIFTSQTPGFFTPDTNGANNKQSSMQGASQEGIGNDLEIRSRQDEAVFQF